MSRSKTGQESFSVTTRFNASAKELYDAWTTKAGAEGWLATEAEVDATVGGKYIFKWPMPDGELSARGEYIELVPAEKVVQTWESWGPEGRFEDGDAIIQVDFTELGDGSTEMTQTEWSAAYKDKERIDMSIGGTKQAHEALAMFVENSKKEKDPG